jgi:hypothetical protein
MSCFWFFFFDFPANNRDKLLRPGETSGARKFEDAYADIRGFVVSDDSDDENDEGSADDSDAGAAPRSSRASAEAKSDGDDDGDEDSDNL